MDFLLKEFETALVVTRIANIHYFEFTRQYSTSADRHAFRELVYVDSGSITANAEGYCGKISESQCLIHRANELHSLSCRNEASANVIIIGFECDCAELDRFSYAPVTLGEVQKRLLTEIIREGRLVFLPPYDVPGQRDMKKRTHYPFGADQLIKLKLESLFIELVRTASAENDDSVGGLPDAKMHKIREYLERNYREKITLSELCFLFETNKTTLCNRFRSAMGDTVVGYVNALRIKEAKRLLRDGSHNLTEIAELVGFSSVHYFSRIFKQYQNQSPKAYVKTIKSRLML